MAAKIHNRAQKARELRAGSNVGTRDTGKLQAGKIVQEHSNKVDGEKKLNNKNYKCNMTQTGKEALRFVTENESTANEPNKVKKRSNKEHRNVNWDEFIHLLLTWLISLFAIAGVLVILSLEEQSTDLFHDVINRIDTLSLMFSLVLSAALEQIWNHKKSKLFQYTLAAELILVIGGLIWYLVCSIHEIQQKDPNFTGNINPVYIERFWIHAIYIALSIFCVIIGFLSRVSVEQEEV